MNVEVLVCTYGDDDWKQRGIETGASVAGQLDVGQGVKVLHHPDKTLAQVRNMAAFAETMQNPDWLCFLDADDRLGDGYLDMMRAAFAARTARDSHGLLVPALKLGSQPAEIPAWERSIYDVNCACIGTLIPARLFRNLGGFREFPVYEDWELWLRAVRAGAKLIPVPEAVYLSNGGSGRNTNDPSVAQRVYREIRAEYADVPMSVWGEAKR